MTDRQYSTIITVGVLNLILASFLVFMLFDLGSDISQQSDRIDSLQNRMSQSAYRDSLVMQHYGTCSFISMDDIAVGYDGYLYSIDWRRRHGRE